MKLIIKKILNKIGIRNDLLKLYWSSNKYLAKKKWDNFGDALVPLLIEKISGKKVKWAPTDEKSNKIIKKAKVYLAIGSILEQAGPNNIVWGSGIMHSTSKLKKSTFLAVRGPISYSRVLASGFKMDKIWGDPALLLPMYFPVPKSVKRDVASIIPHYVDYPEVFEKYKHKEGIEVLDLKSSDIDLLIQKIATSKIVFSSSLHGLIVAHAYGIKAIWVLFSDKLNGDDIKFNDYFMSLNIRLYKPFEFNENLISKTFDKEISVPKTQKLQEVQLNLIKSCPFI